MTKTTSSSTPPKPKFKLPNYLRDSLGDELWQNIVNCYRSGSAFDSVPGLHDRLTDYYRADIPYEVRTGHDRRSIGEWLWDHIVLYYADEIGPIQGLT